MLVLVGCGSNTDKIEEEITTMLKSIEPSKIGVFVDNTFEGNIKDLEEFSFIYQKEFSKGQDAAIQYLKDINRWNDIALKESPNVYQAIKTYKETGDNKAFIIDKAYVEALKENDKTKEYVENLKLIWEYDDVNAYDFSLVNNPFQIYVIGSDDRAAELNDYSHYDVDILLTVNPKTKQVLVLSVPRDTYAKNYAYNEERDKLTYTGIKGFDNAKAAINDYFGQDISLYVLTNFVEFTKMIDFMGGIDIDNPYSFTYTGNVAHFPAGELHLDGTKALLYARERQSLYDWAGSPVGKYNGDMARNMHHLILMKGIINKLVSLETLVNYESLMEQIKECFHTNISFSQMYALAIMQFTEHPDWNVVYQHLYAEYVSDICASEPDLGPLTVGLLDENDVEYVKDLIKKVMDGETITQEPIPSELY